MHSRRRLWGHLKLSTTSRKLISACARRGARETLNEINISMYRHVAMFVEICLLDSRISNARDRRFRLSSSRYILPKLSLGKKTWREERKLDEYRVYVTNNRNHNSWFITRYYNNQKGRWILLRAIRLCNCRERSFEAAPVALL